MADLRVCSIALVATAVMAVAGCVEPEPELGENEQEIGGEQGGDMQGGDMQGGDMQGGDMQGGDMQGAVYGGTAATDATIDGTALSIWRTLRTFPPRLQERRPDRICTWNLSRTTNYGCTTVNLASSASPIAGATFNATFRKPDGTLVQGQVRIGQSATTLGAVSADTSVAMHALYSNATAGACLPLLDCQGGKCRRNCDLWTYDVDAIVNGVTMKLCPPNTRAYAVPGWYDANGTHVAGGFTFACMNGTAAKCTRWGYRPFGQASLVADGTAVDLLPYHKSCVRAAMADYCANGNSFTKDGTYVDIWDNDGFVRRTSDVFPGKNAALLLESTWDNLGAWEIDYLRYEESSALGDLEDPVEGCPTRFDYVPGDDVGLNYHRVEGGNSSGPIINIGSSTGCMHSEFITGKWLNRKCSNCAATVGRTPNFEYCITASSPKAWDAGCVSKANELCKQNGVPIEWKVMAKHHECTVGEKLDRYATGCTSLVCKDSAYSSCCTNQWTSSCVARAAAICPAFISNGLSRPFCYYVQPPSPV